MSKMGCCVVTVSPDGNILHEDGCMERELGDLRASRLRLARALVEVAQSEYGIVPKAPLDEARRIVEGDQRC